MVVESLFGFLFQMVRLLPKVVSISYLFYQKGLVLLWGRYDADVLVFCLFLVYLYHLYGIISPNGFSLSLPIWFNYIRIALYVHGNNDEISKTVVHKKNHNIRKTLHTTKKRCILRERMQYPPRTYFFLASMDTGATKGNGTNVRN